MQDVWLTTAEAAEYLKKPRSWLDNNAGRLGIPRAKLDNQYRYSLAALTTWLEAQTIGTAVQQ